MGVLTFTPSLPSSIRILPMVPSSTASNSIVALSVSISARISPELTSSPSFTSHLASVPSSIVGLRAGMRISVGIVCPSLSGFHVDVCPKLGHIRLGAFLGEFGAVVHDALDLLVDRLEIILAGMLALQEKIAHMFDTVLLLTDFLHLFASTVFRRVRHRVSAIAIGLHLKDVRPLARAAVRDGLLASILDGQNIHAIHGFAGNAERLAASIDIRGRGGPLLRCSHRVLVVLDHKNHRKRPERGHVERLVDLPLVRRAVTEISEGHVVIALVLIRKGQTRTQRHVGAHDPVSSIEVLLLGEHVHGAALALGISVFAARQLGHDTLWVHPTSQHMPVVAIGGDALVTLLGCGLEPDNNGFLPDIKVTETADQAHAIKLTGFFLESPDQKHVAVI